MICLFLYFSGTGNTHYVAEYLAHKLARRPAEVRLHSVEQGPVEAIGDFDLLLVGFPVYACDAPPFFRELLRQLPPGEGRGAFVFCTKGAYAGPAGRNTLQRLATQGYVPLGAGSITMPGTDGLAFIGKRSWLARAAERKDYDRLKSADRLAGRMAHVIQRIQAGASAEDCALHLPPDLRQGPIDWLWRVTYERFTMPLKDRFYADARCDGCGLCVRICPSGNIALHDGQILFADRCYLCMRCVHQCPQEAIQIGRGTVNKFRWRGPRRDFRPLRLYGLGRPEEDEG